MTTLYINSLLKCGIYILNLKSSINQFMLILTIIHTIKYDYQKYLFTRNLEGLGDTINGSTQKVKAQSFKNFQRVRCTCLLGIKFGTVLVYIYGIKEK